jgi:energy-coupling factor transporter ATP-binding protein EcfA2
LALNGLIEELLGTSIDPYGYNDARLFGRPLNTGELSGGQFRLVAFATAFFHGGGVQAPTLVLMDEPENHLHPEAVIRVLDRVKSIAGNVQIWIATHSLPLLANLDAQSIWFIKDGVVSYAGNRTEEVLLSLMGGESNVERLASFLTAPANFALHNFIAECVVVPTVAEAKDDDPQTTAIANILEDAAEGSLRLIDWGAGRGRLAATLQDRISKGEQKAVVDYIAYDPSAANREECRSAMKGFVGSPDDNYFDSLSALTAYVDRRKADIVVMCNVLHEIDPLRWPQVLSADVASVLRDDGVLLVAEDQMMPHGELANAYGFMIVIDVAVHRLFDDHDNLIKKFHPREERYHGRLSTFVIPKFLLSRVSSNSLTKACQWVIDQSKRRIREIREQGASSQKAGRELALKLSQLANATIVLETLGRAP